MYTECTDIRQMAQSCTISEPDDILQGHTVWQVLGKWSNSLNYSENFRVYMYSFTCVDVRNNVFVHQDLYHIVSFSLLKSYCDSLWTTMYCDTMAIVFKLPPIVTPITQWYCYRWTVVKIWPSYHYWCWLKTGLEEKDLRLLLNTIRCWAFTGAFV